MRTTVTLIAMLMAASLTPPAQAASPGPRGVNDCFLSISTPYETADCDYVGAGLFTVIDFSQYSGDIDATVSYTAYSSYYDYSTHEEVLTGPTSCHVAIFEYVPGSGGSGSLHIHNKYE